MRNVTPYEGNAMDHFDAIAASKRETRPEEGSDETPSDLRGILQKLRGYVEDRYREYSEKKPHLELMPAYVRHAGDLGVFCPDEKRALLHCYSGTKALNVLKEKIEDVQQDVTICPYCGIGEPETWDHYLPKSLFPELSVLATNLVPCCDLCNRKKGDVCVEDGERLIVHFYYDPIDQQRPLLAAQVTLKDGTPSVTFSVVDVPDATVGFPRVFRLHCETLELLDRYRRRSRAVLEEIEDDVQRRARDLGTVDPERIARHLQEKVGYYERAHGKSSWKAALWRGVSDARDVIELFARPKQVATTDERGEMAP